MAVRLVHEELDATHEFRRWCLRALVLPETEHGAGADGSEGRDAMRLLSIKICLVFGGASPTGSDA